MGWKVKEKDVLTLTFSTLKKEGRYIMSLAPAQLSVHMASGKGHCHSVGARGSLPSPFVYSLVAKPRLLRIRALVLGGVRMLCTMVQCTATGSSGSI